MSAVLLALLLAHSFYDPGCCDGRDCHPVACSEISPIGDGWVGRGITFSRTMLRASPDGNCHVCHFHDGWQAICIYLPPET